MPLCLLCCDTIVYYVTNNFNTNFKNNEFIDLSLYQHKNSNFLKVILVKKQVDQARVTSHVGRDPFSPLLPSRCRREDLVCI